MIMNPYSADELRNYHGRLICDERELTVEEKQLGRGRMFFLKLECPDHDEDGTVNSVGVLWGDKNRQRHMLVPGQSTEWMAISTLDEVWVRSDGPKAGAGAACKVIFSILV